MTTPSKTPDPTGPSEPDATDTRTVTLYVGRPGRGKTSEAMLRPLVGQLSDVVAGTPSSSRADQ